jgi:hypothetical protein
MLALQKNEMIIIIGEILGEVFRIRTATDQDMS